MSINVALCHSNGSGKPFGCHGVKPHYSDIVKDPAVCRNLHCGMYLLA